MERGIKMKKSMCLVLVGVLFLVAFGCSEKGDSNPKAKSNISKSEKKGEISKKEPKTDPISEEQKKNPLPNGAKPYTGIVIKIDGSKVIIDINGVSYEFLLTDKTNLQKGNDPGTGKLDDLKPQMRINVLVMDGKALTVHY